MTLIKRGFVFLSVVAPSVLISAVKFAGGGGGGGGGGDGISGAPEPAFWTMCAIVAGTETGRRVIKKFRA